MTRFLATLTAAVLLIGGLTTAATAAVIDFEGLSDSTGLTTQISGLAFTNATVLTAGISLNEFDFPPRSGVNVVFDDGGPMAIVFDALQTSVGGFFTYTTLLTLSAFDSSDGLLGSITSAFSSNLGLSGDLGSSPNEFLSLSFAGIKSFSIEGDPAGSSFTLDDLTFPATVPGPSTALLLVAGIAAIGATCFRKKREPASSRS